MQCRVRIIYLGGVQNACPIHKPSLDLTRVDILPQDVGLAVAIEVAGADIMPGGINRIAGQCEALHKRAAVHRPDGGLTTVALPEDLGLAIAGEVRRTLEVPCRSG